jgi:hypothetical protein
VAVRAADLRGAIIADLPRGRIETRDQRRLVALPVEWLERLVDDRASDPTVASALGDALAGVLERDARAVLGDERDPSPEDVGYALSIATAVHGLGVVDFERWGAALVVVWRDPPGRGAGWAAVIAAASAALVGKLSGLNVAGAALGDASRDGEVRVLLASEEVCVLARERARAGDEPAAIFARLDQRSAAEVSA